MDKNIDSLKQKDEELTVALERMQNQSEDNDLDDVIVPTAPLYKQILNLYAEENAIEDTIFYLGEALRRDVIDLDVFLKVSQTALFVIVLLYKLKHNIWSLLMWISCCVQHVRLLSRKQFQLRALMQKARKVAGLSDLYWPAQINHSHSVIPHGKLNHSLCDVKGDCNLPRTKTSNLCETERLKFTFIASVDNKCNEYIFIMLRKYIKNSDL